MDGPADIIQPITNFSARPGKINLNTMEQLTIDIESNGDKHPLVLIKPWPPYSRIPPEWDKIKGLADHPNDIQSVGVFPNSDNPRIEITLKDVDKVPITIPCDSITQHDSYLEI